MHIVELQSFKCPSCCDPVCSKVLRCESCDSDVQINLEMVNKTYELFAEAHSLFEQNELNRKYTKAPQYTTNCEIKLDCTKSVQN